jgi:hypothetical protein
MNDKHMKIKEEKIREWSLEFSYPPTPDIAGEISEQPLQLMKPAYQRRLLLAWVTSFIVLIGVVLIAVPSVRAQILEYLQIGAARIFLNEPIPGESSTESPQGLYPAIADLAGETTLAEAQSKLDFLIRLPSYPNDLGMPDLVYLQDGGGSVLVFIWLNPQDPGKVRLNLLQAAPGALVAKGAPAVLQETTVHNQQAFWLQGGHILQYTNGSHAQVSLMVNGNVLLWEEEGITYRLESDLSLAEAVQIAESLK